MKILLSIFLCFNLFAKDKQLGGDRKLGGDYGLGGDYKLGEGERPPRTCSKDTPEGKKLVEPLYEHTRKVLAAEKWDNPQAKFQEILACNEFNYSMKLAACLEKYLQLKNSGTPISPTEEKALMNKAHECFLTSAEKLWTGAIARMLEHPSTVARGQKSHSVER